MGRKNGQNPSTMHCDVLRSEMFAKQEDVDNYSDCSENIAYLEMSPNPSKRKRLSHSTGRPIASPTNSTPSSSVPYGFPPVRQRQTANARERDRTHSVNSAFTTLRTLIPTEPADRKLSKIETLRLASSYISHLGTILMSGADLRDQPCLRHQFYGGETNGVRSVCTFCLSSCKKTVSYRTTYTFLGFC